MENCIVFNSILIVAYKLHVKQHVVLGLCSKRITCIHFYRHAFIHYNSLALVSKHKKLCIIAFMCPLIFLVCKLILIGTKCLLWSRTDAVKNFLMTNKKSNETWISNKRYCTWNLANEKSSTAKTTYLYECTFHHMIYYTLPSYVLLLRGTIFRTNAMTKLHKTIIKQKNNKQCLTII